MDTTMWSHVAAVNNGLLLYVPPHAIITKYRSKQQLSRKPCSPDSKLSWGIDCAGLKPSLREIETKWKSFPGSIKDNVTDKAFYVGTLFVFVKFISRIEIMFVDIWT
jgi:hypothetical protein